MKRSLGGAKIGAIRAWIARAVVVLGILAATSARAQVPGEEIARRAFEEGVALEKKGDYTAALAKFRESMEIKATVGNRFHIAFCLEMTGRLASALNEYELVDKAARELKKADVVEATRVRVEPLRPRVPQLALNMVPSLPKDGEVLLDGKLIPSGILDGKLFPVDPGEHIVTAHAPDHDTFTKQISLAESSTTTVDIKLPLTARPSNAGPENARSQNLLTAEAPRLRPRTTAIVTTAGAVVLAAGGVAAFVLAGNAQDDAEKTCPTRLVCDDERDKVRTFDALALGGFIGAAGLGVLSIVLWTSKPVGSARTAPALVARPSWIGVEGRF